jgi:Uma2 family endonuclease
MATLLKLRPQDHGRPLSLEEFLGAAQEEGFHYELIDGRVYVSPLPNLPQGYLERWVFRKLDRYAEANPKIVNMVYNKTRLFVPARAKPTAPEPDVAAYRDFPLDIPIEELSWEDVSPILVVEVMSTDDPDKDLVRNVELYRQVPSIEEYWIIDTRQGADNPTLVVYRRRDRSRWRKPLTFDPGATYTTDLLPGFTLVIDPRT